MNKKLTLIIVLQALLIIALFWVLIFYSKDEFETFQNSHDDDVTSQNHINEKDGINIVSLSPATQQNSGIATSKVTTASFAGSIKTTGTVVAIDGLIEAKANIAQAQSAISQARANSGNNLQQYQRLKALNADDKNVSDKAVQDALAAVTADSANVAAAQLQLKNLQNSTKLQWGEALSGIAFSDKLPPHLATLLNHQNSLVQVSLPPEVSAPKTGSTLNISPINDAGTVIKAIYVSPAAQSDANNIGKTFYYSAPAESLRIGMRVNVEAASSATTSNSGALIPNQAIVWFAGKSWAYFKQGKNKAGDDQFVRKPVIADNEMAAGADSGWFNPSIDAGSEVVTSGAQLLLSEELKAQIKNENED
jgi:hypothetical protein